MHTTETPSVEIVSRIFTAEEAAAILRVRKSWLERQAGMRRIPFTLLGGSYRFTASHLQAIIRIFESGPAQEAAPAEVTPIIQRRRTRQSEPALHEPLRARPRKTSAQQNAA
ncbi:helix-turn-helix domain-containing protein [Catenuloplanes sp. NPDC020197]|uniref:helix-turn-helix domain-containing protein n=1 Tax=Catenuloplanes sp. NPDC020197 TaxID=3363958 RepID=UPI0037A69B1D